MKVPFRTTIDEAGKPVTRVQPVPDLPPPQLWPAFPPEQIGYLGMIVHADDENRERALGWLTYYRDLVTDLEAQAERFRSYVVAFQAALSEAEL